MIIRIVKLSVEPEKINEFLFYFDQVKKDIRSFSGCHHLELLGDVEGNGVLFTYSYWDTTAFLSEYLNSALFKATLAKVKPLFKSKAEAWSVEKLQEVNLG
ncbi:MAG TPA: antibiotic biosynthesis monooxygenase [Bacteroidia bacterium]|nr:antibiotic biosynthesis monooxygenase [Bacteroidia bacterium]